MNSLRVFTVEQRRFPDLAGLARDLEQQGVRLVSILNLGVKRDPDYWLYREGLNEGHFCRSEAEEVALAPVRPDWCAFPDFTRPKTRA